MAGGDPNEADLAEHPGRSRDRDEVDPELLSLPRPRPRVGPLLAVAVLVFCGYFLIRLRHDLTFSRQGDTPVRIAGPAQAQAAESDSFVEVHAMPDAVSLLQVFASEATDGHRLAPVLGSHGQLWLMLPGSHWNGPPRADELYRGRLVRLGDLPFYDQLTAKLAEMAPQPHALGAAVVRGALAQHAAAGPGALADVAGDPVDVAGDTEVTIHYTVPGQALVTGYATDAEHDAATWRAALEKAGILPPGAPLVESAKEAWTFRAPAPDGAAAVSARLVSAKLLAAHAAPLEKTATARWSGLSLAEGGAALAVAGGPGQPLPWRAITAITVPARTQAPADARVVVTGEAPGDYWYVLPLYLVLGGFALLFLWALVRALAPDRKAKVASP